jgi:hypothetical protein
MEKPSRNPYRSLLGALHFSYHRFEAIAHPDFNVSSTTNASLKPLGTEAGADNLERMAETASLKLTEKTTKHHICGLRSLMCLLCCSGQSTKVRGLTYAKRALLL